MNPNVNFNSVMFSRAHFAGAFAHLPHEPRLHQAHESSIVALPRVMQSWVAAICTKVRVHESLALSTLLSGMSAGLHGGYSVLLPDHGEEPASLFSMVLAGPTTGKTVTHRLVHLAHSEIDIELTSEHEDGLDALEGVREEGEHPASKSSKKRLRTILQQDTSNIGLLEALEGVGESAALSVHEGRRALQSPLFSKHLETLNELYDGFGAVSVTRGRKSRLRALNASLTLLVMVQPDIFSLYLDRSGAEARGNGFFARCLFTIALPVHSACGVSVVDPDAILAGYHAKVRQHLKHRLSRLKAKQFETIKLSFSHEASNRWHEIAALHRNKFRISQDNADADNRALQNLARLAGIIHCYTGEGHEIARATLEASWSIIQCHLLQFELIFPAKKYFDVTPIKPTVEEKRKLREHDDMNRVTAAIRELASLSGKSEVSYSTVLTMSGLYHQRFRAALIRLIALKHVIDEGAGMARRLKLNFPSPFPAPPALLYNGNV